MCRAEIAPEAAAALDALLRDIARVLADEVGADLRDVEIGPVDFGPAEGEHP